MTPAALAQMIEALPPEDKEAAEEYIYLLHSNSHLSDLTESERKYREYILQGIREGEEAFERGDYYDVESGRKKLLELMKK
ncbi:MAG: hypothetical protein ABI778_09795 [Ignavibacteriota bacterium]